jgi:hypothetical protein
MTRQYRNISAKKGAIALIMIVQIALGSVSVARANTILIFRTGRPPGAVAIPFNHPVDFGSLPVSQYRRIRICANSNGSVSNVKVRLLIVQDNVPIGELEPIVLTPNSLQTKLYEVPGLIIRVVASSAPATGSTARSNALDMAVYGSD